MKEPKKRQYKTRSRKKEAWREEINSMISNEVHWQEFHTKYQLLEEWIERKRKWPTKKDTITVRNHDNQPYIFKIGKWVINKRHYSHGFKKGRTLHPRGASIHEQMKYINELFLQCKSGIFN